jgi:hypothetical protein
VNSRHDTSAFAARRDLYCLTSYDWPGAYDAGRWVTTAQWYFAQLGIEPTRCVVVSEGGTRSRTYSYAQLAGARLEAVEQITLLREQASTTPRKWICAAAFSARSDRHQQRYTFAFEGEYGLASHGYLLQHLMRQLADHDALGYGMVFRWNRPTDPLFYAAGLGYSRHAARSVRGPPVWRLHLHGKFRDVYPMNFLLKAHLDADVGQRSLAEAVHSDPGWGRLERLSHTAWLWTVEESQRRFLRSELEAAELLI